MRQGLSWVLALALGGCVYIGGINYAPEGEVVVETVGAKRGDWVEVAAKVTDRDGDSLRFEWEVEVTPATGAPYTLSLSDQGSDGGIGLQMDSGVAPGGLLVPASQTLEKVQVMAAHRGSYAVKLRALDEQGASRELETSFEVGNQPPVITPALDVETRFKMTDRYPDNIGDGLIRNPAHAHYMVWLKEDGTSDHEQDLECGGASKVEYTLVKPDMALSDYFDVVPCAKGELLDKLRFRLDPTKVKTAQTVEIQVKVDDGHGGTAKESVKLDVVPNRPACIKAPNGTYPPIPPSTLKVPVMAKQGRRFEVTWTDDDVNEGQTYTWLVRDPAGSFELVQQGASGAVLEMPAWFRMPGQEVELRVVVADRVLGTTLPACSDETAQCRAVKELPKDCYQWVTWRVQFL
jgi:hypothetical protein